MILGRFFRFKLRRLRKSQHWRFVCQLACQLICMKSLVKENCQTKHLDIFDDTTNGQKLRYMSLWVWIVWTLEIFLNMTWIIISSTKSTGAQVLLPQLSWEKLRSPSTPAAFIWGLGWHPKMTPHELAWWLGVKLPCNSDFVGKSCPCTRSQFLWFLGWLLLMTILCLANPKW